MGERETGGGRLTSPTRVVTCMALSSSSRVMKNRGYMADTRK